MASKFTAENRGAILDLLADGISLRDACREVGINEKTVKGWLTRGRKEGDGDYAEFAVAVDASRQEAAEAEAPMNGDELRLVVSRAAKNGSVQAQKLYWEMLRAGEDPGEEEEADPLAELDELAERRVAQAR
jgi:IS30 family transposase